MARRPTLPEEPVTIRAARKEEAGFLSDLALRSKACRGYPPEFIEACRNELTYTESMASRLGATQLVIQGDPNAEHFYLAVGGFLTGTRESGSISGRLLPTFTISLSPAGD